MKAGATGLRGLSKGPFQECFSLQRDKINFELQGDGLITAINSQRIPLLLPFSADGRRRDIDWRSFASGQQLNQQNIKA